MSYPPQYPGGPQQPYPQQGYGQPGYPAPMPPQLPPPPASGATAITAAILGLLGVLAHGLLVMVYIYDMISWEVYPPISVILTVVSAVIIGLLLFGAILVFTRKPVSRWLLVAGSGLEILRVLGIVIYGLSVGANFVLGGAETPNDLGGWFGVVPAIATFVLALVPSTGDYLNGARRQPRAGYGQPGYGPYPPQSHPQQGYPPQGYGQPPQW
ncbi:hypothetical protein EV191_101258 [Tamaricihabitans halophyticus]|uniref:Uncharacterized protein n=1 Tax=Tamaricihabitans halophyticus TaxID=1262583 RepID=A0A4R2R2T3_9PSEU|nr:hypothetical protein [Tamaricihabitans halophyticus]TCP56317.1 hypothetical protein EV191_101258 [Tamaricihabitans halophyticus]